MPLLPTHFLQQLPINWFPRELSLGPKLLLFASQTLKNSKIPQDRRISLQDSDLSPSLSFFLRGGGRRGHGGHFGNFATRWARLVLRRDGRLRLESGSVPVQAIRLVRADSEAEAEEDPIREKGFLEEDRRVAGMFLRESCIPGSYWYNSWEILQLDLRAVSFSVFVLEFCSTESWMVEWIEFLLGLENWVLIGLELVYRFWLNFVV